VRYLIIARDRDHSPDHPDFIDPYDRGERPGRYSLAYHRSLSGRSDPHDGRDRCDRPDRSSCLLRDTSTVLPAPRLSES
jgi:hypothetical protein